jgi:hypothetical protein
MKPPPVLEQLYKADNSLKSFIFTLKNPHNIPPKRFALKAAMKAKAIYCSYDSGPWFLRKPSSACAGPAFGHDIIVHDNCNATTQNYSSLGSVYSNNTVPDEKVVLTGETNFQVREIEVFEIT